MIGLAVSVEQAMDEQDLSPAAVNALIKGGAATLVDVREAGEFAMEHIEGAVLHPLSSFDPMALPPGRLVFHCGIGKRSLSAIQRCAAAGAAHGQHLQGGLAAWKQAGLPTRRG
jgi:rhodanese-related sulfurtransferase